MPEYQWKCSICDSSVEAGKEECPTCGHQSDLSREDIELFRAQYQKKTQESGIIFSTTPQLEGHAIEEYLGVVVGEAVLGANIVRDLFAGIRDIVGGRSNAYETELKKARSIAFTDLGKEAYLIGANAVVGIDLDYEVMGAGGSIMMVSVSGTAVRTKKI